MGEDEALTDHPMRNLSEGIRKQVTWLSSWHGNEVMKVQWCEGMRTCVNCGESGAWSWQWVLKSKATPDWFNKRWICVCCLCVAKSMNYIFIDSIQGKKSFQIFKLLKSLANSLKLQNLAPGIVASQVLFVKETLRHSLQCIIPSSGLLILCPMCVCSIVSDSATPWTVAHQAPPSMEFSRQEYWMGCHFLLQGMF